MTDELDLVVIYQGIFPDASRVRSLLEESGIEAFLRDEFMSTIYSVAGIKVVVARKDIDRVTPIIQQFQCEKQGKFKKRKSSKPK